MISWHSIGRQWLIAVCLLGGALSSTATQAERDEAALEAELSELKAVLQRVAIEQNPQHLYMQLKQIVLNGSLPLMQLLILPFLKD